MDFKRFSDDMIVFDIDGILCKYDFGTLNKKIWEPHDWIRLNLRSNPYNHAVLTKIFDELIKLKKPDDLCTLSTALSSAEETNKREFLKKNYPKIPQDQVYFVGDDKYKVDVLMELRQSLNNLKMANKKIIMIEDSVSVMASIETMNIPLLRCMLISDFL